MDRGLPHTNSRSGLGIEGLRKEGRGGRESVEWERENW